MAVGGQDMCDTILGAGTLEQQDVASSQPNCSEMVIKFACCPRSQYHAFWTRMCCLRPRIHARAFLWNRLLATETNIPITSQRENHRPPILEIKILHLEQVASIRWVSSSHLKLSGQNFPKQWLDHLWQR